MTERFTPRDAEAPETGMGEDLVTVRLLRFPLRLFARAQAHSDELMREFTLLRLPGVDHPHPAPAALARLVDDLSSRYAAAMEAPDRTRDRAQASGQPSTDLAYVIPRAAGVDARRLADLLTQADEYCRAGDYLLTVPRTPEVVAFTRWYTEEFARQAEGAEPIPWPGPLD